ncbi:hypothetical protein Dsin_024364 [Dipteronia sinensis]|uniref:Uncharacterized protein n=1 Tax=Dipteronia sinensis TaxID=43782 RepID=A0AAE0DXB9_9ROSI|nr:hypothetical protein Dsin_024364 [Dipteronia sinensis]
MLSVTSRSVALDAVAHFVSLVVLDVGGFRKVAADVPPQMTIRLQVTAAVSPLTTIRLQLIDPLDLLFRCNFRQTPCGTGYVLYGHDHLYSVYDLIMPLYNGVDCSVQLEVYGDGRGSD